MGEDAELWKAFIARDIPKWEEKICVPANPTKWYKVYRTLKTERDEQIARDRESLRQSMNAVKQHKEAHVSKFVDIRKMPKIPRDYGMRAHNNGAPLNKGKLQNAPPSTLTWGGGSRTKMTDGKSVLTKARREAKEMSQRNKLNLPTNMLSGDLGQVKRAPAGMTQSYKIASQPTAKILMRRGSSARNLHGIIAPARRGPSLEDREQRLRDAMSSKKQGSNTFKESSTEPEPPRVMTFDSDSDDLFDEPKEPKPARKIMKPGASSSSSPPPKTSFEPSDVISSMAHKSRASSPASSHSSRTAIPKPMMPARKRHSADIFYRGPKKPRR